ncbi:hypothetical protein HAL_24300 [Haladaptatus sp. T7]|nr:hypothetical protein HAL_24300 [Haladaptatus sp. T7]
MILGGIVFVWYGYVSTDILVGIASGIIGLIASIESITAFNISGGGNGSGSAPLAATLTKGVYYGTIGIGGIGLVAAWRSQGRDSLSPMWVVFGIVAFIGLGATFITTRFFGGYGPFRMFYQLLPFISIPIIIGVSVSARVVNNVLNINRELLAHIVVAVFLVIHLFAGTYAFYDLTGTPHGELFATEGKRVDTSLVNPSEDEMARWINEYATTGVPIWADYHGEHIIARYKAVEARDGLGLVGVRRQSISDYIILRTENVDQSMVNTKYRGKYDLSRLRQVIEKKNKVYASGAEVYR